MCLLCLASVSNTGRQSTGFLGCRFLFFVWSFQCATSLAGPCSKFRSESMGNGSLVAEENTTVNIMFELQKENCGDDDLKNLVIAVMKKGKDGATATHCSIRYTNGTCIDTLDSVQHCKCLEQPGTYMFSKTVYRNDTTSWLWTTDPKVAETKEIIFDVRYPARVTDIIVNGTNGTFLANVTTSIQIVCFYERGNPPITARLLDKHGLHRTVSSVNNDLSNTGQIRYGFQSVKCEDAGLIRCEAPGASINKTATLLVRCLQDVGVIQKNVAIITGQPLTISLHLLSHTVAVRPRLVKDPFEVDQSHLFNISLSGIPPDLTLTAWLDNVRKKDEGQWALVLSNDIGDIRWRFNLTVSERGTFVFPGVQDSILHLKNNTDLILKFKFIKDKSPKEVFQNFSLSVRNKIKTVCNIVHIDGQCFTPKNQICSCTEEPDTYLINKTVSQDDDGTWIWFGSDKKAVTREILFDIRYDSFVRQLLLLNSSLQPSDLMDENSAVTVVCFVDVGNPPVKARLLDRRGVEMEDSNHITGQIRYTFTAVGCQDAGLIRCEAPGASENRTATLLVKCPPQLEMVSSPVEFEAGGEVSLNVKIRSHTADFQKCSFKKDFGGLSFEDCLGGNVSRFQIYFRTDGSPPDLTLTVRLQNVSKEDEGQWRLELTNEAGTGHMEFRLTAKSTAERGYLTALAVAIASGTASFAAVVVAIAVAVLVVRRLSSRADPSIRCKAEFHSSRQLETSRENLNLSASRPVLQSGYSVPRDASCAYAISEPLAGSSETIAHAEGEDKLHLMLARNVGSSKKGWKKTDTFQWHAM